MTNETRDILIKQAVDGSQVAISELIQDTIPFVTIIVKKRVPIQDVDDIVQDTMHKIVERIHLQSEDQRFLSWVTSMANNNASDYWRKKYRRKYESLDASDESVCCTSFETPEKIAIEAEGLNDLAKAMDELQEDQRNLIRLFYVEQQPLKAIAEFYDRPMGTIKRRLHTARQKLKELMASI